VQTLLFPSQSDRDPRARAVNTSWRPPEPPSLDGINELDLDTETNGLHWWNGHRPIGMSLALPKGTVYLPWGHRGGNLDEDMVKRWARQELRGKRLRGFNLKFDVHMLREWGVDLEAQGCTLNDLSLSAALLDDHRMKFKLEDIAQEFLGIGKLKDVDVEHLAELHASEVAPYAERDVELTARLSAKMRPLLEQQELTRVQALEDATIFAVCEMERNAAPIDVSLLNRWVRESAADVLRIVQEIDKITGVRVDPQKTASFEEVFLERGLELSARTEGGAWSFDDEVMSGYDDPIIKKLQYARRLSSLRAKYLMAYHRALHNGQLRYNLHQLRGDFEESAGTITGRFSASDKNIQQVMAVEKQIERFGGAYIIRELFLPDGGLFLSADAAQIEYRLFADKAASPKLLAAYKQDPRTSFHKVVWEMVKPFKADIQYKAVKNLNFASLYGAGIRKIAHMLHVPEDEAKTFVRAYDGAFPEVKRLLTLAARRAEERGWVKTLSGRRIRFVRSCECRACARMGPRFHKALNGVIQGSAADVMKTKLVELHAERKYTGLKMRFTVHDEVCGDVPDHAAAGRVHEVLNRQSYELKVPILWETAVGPNWGKVTALKDNQFTGTVGDDTRDGRSRNKEPHP